jgi:polar amino acid transport system substrate-binding protein
MDLICLGRRLSVAAGLILASSAIALAQDCQTKISPSDLVMEGSLTMSTNPTLPPLQFVDSSGALKGMRIELATEIAKRLCLKPDYVKIEFDAMIPGLQGGRWDMINTGIFFTPARVKLMYMIPYENEAISISVRNQDKDKVMKIEDLAGKTVGVEIGGFEEAKTHAVDEALKQKGLPGSQGRTGRCGDIDRRRCQGIPRSRRFRPRHQRPVSGSRCAGLQEQSFGARREGCSRCDEKGWLL